MSKIRVLEFSNQWSIGGVEKTIQFFMQHFDRDKFEVYAAGWRDGDRLPLIKPLAEETFINEDPEKMMEWIKSKKIDIAHFHRMGKAEPPLIDVLVKAGVPTLIEHNIFGHFDPSADRIKIDKHLFVSRVQIDIYKNRAGIMFEEDKCDYVYNPVDIDSFEKYDWSKRDFSKPIIGKYTRKESTKWHPLNVECLPLVKKAIPDAEFHVIGLPDDYKRRIDELGVSDMVKEFPSTLNENELKDFLSRITVLNHGTVYGESFGITIAESMASGLPVVTHTGGDSAQTELVTHNENGFVVEQDDVQGFADNIIKLLKDPELKKSMGEKGKQRAKDWFNVKKLTKRLESIFINVHEGKTNT